jgi:cyclohexyl-isocyanide hydratase
MNDAPEFVIGIPIYQGVDLMDVAAPSEVFSCLIGYWKERRVKIYHVAERMEQIVTRDGTILYPHKTFAELPAVDLLWTPGGVPAELYKLMHTPAGTPFLDYLRQVSLDASWVTSVCEGALLIAQAGLLDGFAATTHWAFMNCLREYPLITVIEAGHPRFVIDGNRITGAGISSGIDEALQIVKMLAGTDVAVYVQQYIQYFPQPPVHGSIPPAEDCPVVPP